MVLHFRRNHPRWSAVALELCPRALYRRLCQYPRCGSGVYDASWDWFNPISSNFSCLEIVPNVPLEPTIRSIGMTYLFVVCLHHDSVLPVLSDILHPGDLQLLQLDPVVQVYRGQHLAHLLAGYGIGKVLKNRRIQGFTVQILNLLNFMTIKMDRKYDRL